MREHSKTTSRGGSSQKGVRSVSPSDDENNVYIVKLKLNSKILKFYYLILTDRF